MVVVISLVDGPIPGYRLSAVNKHCISRNRDKPCITRRGEACHSTFSDLNVEHSVAVGILHVMLAEELTTGAVDGSRICGAINNVSQLLSITGSSTRLLEPSARW